MVTNHVTVPSFVAEIVFEHKSYKWSPEESCFDLPVKFFLKLTSKPL